MNTTAALAGIALIGTITAVVTGLAVSQMDNIAQIDPKIENDNMYKLDDQLVVELVNRGQPINTSKIDLLYDYHGITYNHSTLEQEMQREKNCLPANSTWSRGQRVECRTGIEFPSAGNELELILTYKNENAWTAVCKPSTSDAVGC